MGFTSWIASHYKRGRIDRVAEITSNLTPPTATTPSRLCLKSHRWVQPFTRLFAKRTRVGAKPSSVW